MIFSGSVMDFLSPAVVACGVLLGFASLSIATAGVSDLSFGYEGKFVMSCSGSFFWPKSSIEAGGAVDLVISIKPTMPGIRFFRL